MDESKVVIFFLIFIDHLMTWRRCLLCALRSEQLISG